MLFYAHFAGDIDASSASMVGDIRVRYCSGTALMQLYDRSRVSN